MTTTDSNLNQLIINELTQAEYDAATINPNELYVITDGVMQSSDVINALGYTPVNKSGDTMTGNLEISNVSPRVNCINTVFDYTDTSAPSSQLDIGNFSVFDKNGKAVGGINCQHNTYNNFLTTLYARRSIGGTEKNAYNTLWVDSSGDGHFTFPQSSCVDGQWVYSYSSIVSSDITMTNTYSNDFSVSTYLPNDSYKYEIIVGGMATSATSTGSTVDIRIGSDLMTTPTFFLRTQTRANASVQTANSITIEVGTGRKIHIESYGSGVFNALRVYGYKRMGSNT